MSNSREVNNSYKNLCNGTAAGAFGGLADVVFCYPFFGEKIREQIQSTKGSGWRLSRLYRGSMLYGAVVVPSTAVMAGATTAGQHDVRSVIASGFLSSLMTTPLVNTISKRELNPVLTSKEAFQQLHAQGGLRRLYCGWFPTAIADGMYSAGAFLGVPHAEKYLIEKYEISAFQARFLAGMSVGMVSAFFSHPCDTAAIIMGATGEPSVPKVVTETVKKNGVAGMYAGFFWRSGYIAASILAVSTTVEAVNKKLNGR